MYNGPARTAVYYSTFPNNFDQWKTEGTVKRSHGFVILWAGPVEECGLRKWCSVDLCCVLMTATSASFAHGRIVGSLSPYGRNAGVAGCCFTRLLRELWFSIGSNPSGDSP
jgi:hypothetical protein